MAPRRITMFHPTFAARGAAEILALDQGSFLAGRGIQVDIVTYAHDPGLWDASDRLPMRIAPWKRWHDVLRVWDRESRERIRGRSAVAMLGEADVVLAHNAPASAILGGARVRGAKVWQCNEPPRGLHLRQTHPVLTLRAESPEAGPEWATKEFRTSLGHYDQALAQRKTFYLRRRIDLEDAGGLDHIYATSAFTRDSARAIYGRCQEEPVYPIVRFPQGDSHRPGLDRAGLNVLTHSSLESHRNVDTVIRGFAAYLPRSPGSRLHVVGEGPMRARLELLAAELLPAGAYRFHGHLPPDDLRLVYGLCDVFALLPLDEPFGMNFPKAAALGLLLVGSDHGGPMEILDGGRLGWVCDPFSPEALAEKLGTIAGLSDEDADRMRSQADKVCRARFSAETVGGQLLRVLDVDV